MKYINAEPKIIEMAMPGMILAEHVLDNSNKVVFPAGTILTIDNIIKMRELEIESLTIKTRPERIKTTDIKHGMILAADVKNELGNTVLAVGSVLTKVNVENIIKMSVESVIVKTSNPYIEENNTIRGKKAIIIDGSPYFRNMFSKMLYRMGMLVCKEIENLEEGIRSIDQYKPALVIIDTELSRANSGEAIKRVRGKQSNIKVIATSTSKDKNKIVDALKAGANDYMIKPIKWVQFESRVIKIFQNGNS